ncbi:ABC transporter ATP-binding protein [Methanoculleus bourgensis]|uniref:Macrolide export ATP-binding/permease protein MacB n=1 Tax=Methanoculleus bourgensis TaxID=83986 RepID=A0A0X8XXV9_9EURY
METIIEAMHLNKAYNDQVTALLDVNFAIGKGEFVALLGRSGSGKSTLLNILGGLDAPTSGEVRIDGRNVDFGDRKALIALRREAIGFIFQSFNLIPALTAQENVEYPLLFNYHEKAARRERAADLLATVGLADRAHHYPREMRIGPGGARTHSYGGACR